MKTLHCSPVASPDRLTAPRFAAEIAERIQNIQDALLPFHTRFVSGVECAGRCERSGNLGGDFFDFLLPRADEVLAAIGNVAVTGVPGSLVTTGLHVCLRTLGRRGVPLPDLNGEINRMVWQIAPDQVYASMFSARISPARRELRYVNAGHETALIIRGGIRMDRLEPNCPVLGLNEQSIYRERAIAFHPGDTLIAVSDGIAEAAEATDRETCEQALFRILQAGTPTCLGELPGEIIEAVRDLAGTKLAGTKTAGTKTAGTKTKDRTVIAVHYCRRHANGTGAAHMKLSGPAYRAAAAAD